MWNELPFLWNELTILWNDLTIDWNDLTWNDLTMERNDRIPLKRWTRFFETFPVGPNRSIEFWTEVSGNFG